MTSSRVAAAVSVLIVIIVFGAHPAYADTAPPDPELVAVPTSTPTSDQGDIEPTPSDDAESSSPDSSASAEPPSAPEESESVGTAPDPLASEPMPEVVVTGDAAVAPGAEVADTGAAGVSDDVVIAALPPTASDSALIAWIGTDAEPVTKLTLQAALNSAPPDGTVQLVPSPSGYRFASVLVVPSAVHISAATSTTIYGRLTLAGTGLSTSEVSLSPTANGQTVLTISAIGASVSDLDIANPESFTGTTGIAVGAGLPGVVLSRIAIDGTATGINLSTSTGVTIADSTITRVATGITASASSAQRGPEIDRTTVEFTSRGILLGTTTEAHLSTVSLTGPGLGTTYAIDYQSATAIEIVDVNISSALHGIGTSILTTTGIGPSISGGSITVTGTGIGLAATIGATITGTTLTRVEPTNNAVAVGINVLNASSVTITDVVATGFREGILVAPANTASGPNISGGRIAAVVSGIALGGSTAPRITGVTLDGQLRPAATVIATVGVELASSTSASIDGLTVNNVARGINAPTTNTAAGPTITSSNISLSGVAAATGINLGSTDSASVTSVTVTGTSRGVSRSTGINTNRARSVQITDVRMSSVSTGIGATWERLTGRDIPGHTITGADVSDVGIGIYTANTTGTVVRDSVIDAWGEGVAGHEDANFTLERTRVSGHTGSTFQNGTNCIRFYYTDGMTVTDVTTTGGATGLYLDMSSDATATRIDISGSSWYGTYAESITGYVIQDSAIHDNAGIGNLTINPTSQDALDQRLVSSGILFEDSTFTDNVAGLYMPLGAYDITFRDNVVRGTSTYVLLGAPAHDVTVTGNRIDYTHDPALSSVADALAAAPSLGDPPLDPPLPDTPPEEGPPDPAPAALNVVPFLPLVMSPTPPSTAHAAIWIAPIWFNLDSASASSSDVDVVSNVFTGDGPFVGVGTTVATDRGTTDAPTDPSAMRSLRDTIDVSLNVFPRDSTAIVTVANAETGADSDPTNAMINSNAAVDARGANDWGSVCYARVPTDGYDGGGAYIHELRATQVLYPQACAQQPAADPYALARSGSAVSPADLYIPLALITLGAIILITRTGRHATHRNRS